MARKKLEEYPHSAKTELAEHWLKITNFRALFPDTSVTVTSENKVVKNIPLHVASYLRGGSRIATSHSKSGELILQSLEDICANDKESSDLIGNHFKQRIPFSVKNPAEFNSLRKDLTFFLGAVGFSRPEPDLLQDLIRASKRGFRKGSIFQKAIFHYVENGGSMDDFGRLDDLTKVAPWRSGNPFQQLMAGKLYRDGGYSSFPNVIDLFHEFKPKNKTEFENVSMFLESTANYTTSLYIALRAKYKSNPTEEIPIRSPLSELVKPEELVRIIRGMMDANFGGKNEFLNQGSKYFKYVLKHRGHTLEDVAAAAREISTKFDGISLPGRLGILELWQYATFEESEIIDELTQHLREYPSDIKYFTDIFKNVKQINNVITDHKGSVRGEPISYLEQVTYRKEFRQGKDSVGIPQLLATCQRLGKGFEPFRELKRSTYHGLSGFRNFRSLLEEFANFSPTRPNQVKTIAKFLTKKCKVDKGRAEKSTPVVRLLFHTDFAGDYSYLPELGDYALAYMQSEGASSESLEQSLRSFSPLSRKLKIRSMALLSAQKRSKNLDKLTAIVNTDIQADPAIINNYEREFGKASTDAVLLAAQYVASRKTGQTPGIKQRLEKLFQDNFTENHAYNLLRAYNQGRLGDISIESLKMVLPVVARFKVPEFYSERETLDKIAKSIGEQARSIEIYGQVKMATIDEKIRTVVGFESGKERGIAMKRYWAYRESIYEATASLDEAQVSIVEDDYLIEFLHQLGEVVDKSSTEKLEMVETFISRSKTLLFALRNLPKEERKQEYATWVGELLSKESGAGLMHYLNMSNVTETLNAAVSVAQLVDQREVLEKFASIFSGRACTIRQTDPLIGQLRMPTLQPGRINLPEFIDCFPELNQNKVTYKALMAMQTGAIVFGFTPENWDTQFTDLNNPYFAQRIYSAVTYLAVEKNMLGSYNGLYGILQSVKVGQEVQLEETIECQRVAEILEQELLFSSHLEDEAVPFVHEILLPHINRMEDYNFTSAVEVTRKIYDLIGKEFYICPIETEKPPQFGNAVSKVHLVSAPTAAYENSFTYYELNGTQKARVIVREASGVENDRVSKIKKEQATQIRKTIRALEAIKPNRVVVERRVYDGELDEDAYGEMQLELEAGKVPDTNVYKNRRIRDRDVALLLSINQSKSLGKWLDDNNRIMDYVRPVITYLAEATRALEDGFAVMGYTSRGPNDSFLNIFKSFDEDHTAEVDNRVGLLAPLYAARTGVIYRHIAKIFEEHSAKRKIQFDLVMDLATDKGYVGEAALHDTMEAAKNLRSSGVELYGVCLNQEIPPQNLEKVYGVGHFRQITHPERLAHALVDVYQLLTLS